MGQNINNMNLTVLIHFKYQQTDNPGLRRLRRVSKYFLELTLPPKDPEKIWKQVNIQIFFFSKNLSTTVKGFLLECKGRTFQNNYFGSGDMGSEVVQRRLVHLYIRNRLGTCMYHSFSYGPKRSVQRYVLLRGALVLCSVFI